MKRFRNGFAIILTMIILITALSGCSGNKDNIDFIYPFGADVRSYDPQVASTSDEFLIIENTFEGLVRINDDGTIQKGVADSWDISADGLTYTFHLKQGLKWDINTDKNDAGEYKDARLELLGYEFNPDITAHDFVFALRRAAMPETDSASFYSISSIKNANAIHNKKADASTLGAVATDDYTLVIQLDKADDAFLDTLTTAVAMPCNEEFFNATKGRYGLSTKYTLFNGQFYVNQILESSYLLRRNDRYLGDYPASAKELTLKIPSADTTDKETLEKLESGYYDAVFIRGDESDKIKDKSGISYVPYEDTMWAFILNTNDEVLQSKTMRKAFCQGFERINPDDKEYISPAYNVSTPNCNIGKERAIDLIGSTVVPQDIDKSIENWQKAITLLDTRTVEINVLTPDYMEDYTKAMLQGIQRGIGTSLKNDKGESIDLSLKIVPMTENEMRVAIKKGEYDIALYPFKSSTSSTISFLQSFCDDNVTGISTKELQSYITRASKQKNNAKTVKEIKRAEKAITLNYSICPMIYETSYYASAKGVSNIQFHPGTGRVSFVNATREN